MTATNANISFIDCPPQALAEIRAKCEAIDGSAEFAIAKPADALEARLLRKIDVAEEVLAAHGVAMPVARRGVVDRLRVLGIIRHIGAKPTDAIKARFEELDARHRRAPNFRHNPERQIDLDIDRYEVLLADRDQGPPRSVHRLNSISVEGSAEEMGCDPASIDRLAYRRLNAIAAGMPPGPVHYGTGPGVAGVRIAPRSANPAIAILAQRQIAASTGRFPQDPLHTNRLDVITFASMAGVGVPDIVFDPAVHAIVEAAATSGTAKLVEHPLVAGRRYTYAQLIEWARDEGRLLDPSEEVGEPATDVKDGESVNGAGERGGFNVGGTTSATLDRIASRKQVHALREYIRRFGGPKGDGELVPLDFKGRLERTVRGRASEFGPGWRGLVGDWIGWNDDFRATQPIPDSFALTIRLLCREVGLTLSQLAKGLCSVRDWADGIAVPAMKSEPQLTDMARRLRVPVSLLNLTLDERYRKRYFDIDSDMFPNATRHLPIDFDTLGEDEQLAMLEANHWRHARQGTLFGRRQAYMKADEYALPSDRWTPEMMAAWEATKPEKGDDAKLFRKLGEPSRRRDTDGKFVKKQRPWRGGTADFKESLLVYYLGYLHRPRDVADLAPMVCAAARLPSAERGGDADGVPEFVREGGLGIPTELLKPAILALNNLVVTFVWWKIRRSGQLVRTIPHTLKALARMLKPGTGVIWKSPEMLADLEAFAAWWAENPYETADGEVVIDIEPFRRDWQGAVRAAYDTMIEDITDLMDGDIKPSRDSFLTISTFIEDEDELPMVKYMVGVRTLLAARPHTIASRHKHVRDCVQTLILCQTGLRTYNMIFTYDDGTGMPARRRNGRDGKVLEPTLIRSEKNGKVRWTIDIPSGEFKNWYSPYFKDTPRYRFVLRDEDGLYKLLETYVTRSRVYFLRGRKSDAFFVSSKNKDMDERSLATTYKWITGQYFVANPTVRDGGVEGAMQHAMHAVRHVIATHIVKVTGNLHLAAFAIQDTVGTVEKHYARFMPSDKANHADAVLAKARAAGRPAATANSADDHGWLRAA